MPYKNKEDERRYQREHYQRNKELYKRRAIESRRKQIEENKKFLLKYLSEHPCIDCGTKDIRVLQFDHKELRSETGRKTVGRYIGSRGLLEKELAECDVRCANCHMIKTSQQFGWERLL